MAARTDFSLLIMIIINSIIFKIFNFHFSLVGYVPLKWKHAHVLLFHKPGKYKIDLTSLKQIN